MAGCSINHVSIVANPMDESVEFYEDLIGLQQVPSPNFGVDVVWLEDSEGKQLHLFERDVPIPRYHHFGMTVDDFESVYWEAKDRDVITDFREDTDSSGLYRLPDGAVQLYVNDPAGNLVELNWPDIESLDENIRDKIVDLDDVFPQTGEATDATLSIGSMDKE